jgi:hypothetical protein
MIIKQNERFQKIFYENLYLLKIHNNNHDFVFKVSGSTSNVYTVRINKSFEWNNIFCDCPDSKKWANIHGVVCKHCIFIIFKVLKLFTFKNQLSIISVCEKGEEFLQKRKLNKDYIEVINIFLELFKFEDNDFIRSDYVEKYNQLKTEEYTTESKQLEMRDGGVTHCIICFDDFDKELILSKEVNSQCLVCKNIFHNECVAKWFLHNKSCPYCRSPSNMNTNYTDSNNQYFNLL